MVVLGDNRKAFEVNVTHVYHKDKLARRGSLHGNPIGRTIMIYTEESDICACPFLKLEKTYLLAGHLDDDELLLKRKKRSRCAGSQGLPEEFESLVEEIKEASA